MAHSEKFDDQGLNVADPNDSKGLKSEYIALLQNQALSKIIGESAGGLAVDVGCGAGRMTRFLHSLGFRMIGIDPSSRLLEVARRSLPEASWCAGSLPDLPLRLGSVDTVFLINVLRVLHLMGTKDACVGIPGLLRTGGRLVILDNIAPGHRDFVEHDWIVRYFTNLGLQLESVSPIRFGRRITTYMIRYGLVPRRLFADLAAKEIKKARMYGPNKIRRGCRYMNVVYVFRLTNSGEAIQLS